MAILLEGKPVAQAIKDAMKSDVEALGKKGLGAPTLACIIVGDNAASSLYVKSQVRVAEEVGIRHRLVSLRADITQDDLVAEIVKLNMDKSVHGIMVHTPLPRGLNMEKALTRVLPEKDAEGMHPENLGRLLLGESRIAPCTASACIELLRHHGIKLYGKETVVVGHSNIVGKPLILLLLKEFATTTVCHIATSEAHKLEGHVRRAEVLVVAVGKAHLIKGDWIKEGAIVLDVGINREHEKLVGDVEFEAASKKASYITPVPGGVGPLTVTMLMKNCVELFKQSVG